jgi:hypothetical protein
MLREAGCCNSTQHWSHKGSRAAGAGHTQGSRSYRVVVAANGTVRVADEEGDLVGAGLGEVGDRAPQLVPHRHRGCCAAASCSRAVRRHCPSGVVCC